MAKAKVKTIYEHRYMVSDREEIVFELFRWRSEYRTTYELEIYKVITLTENKVFPVLNTYDFEIVDQRIIVADSDGEAINRAVGSYNKYETAHTVNKLAGYYAKCYFKDEVGKDD